MFGAGIMTNHIFDSARIFSGDNEGLNDIRTNNVHPSTPPADNNNSNSTSSTNNTNNESNNHVFIDISPKLTAITTQQYPTTQQHPVAQQSGTSSLPQMKNMNSSAGSFLLPMQGDDDLENAISGLKDLPDDDDVVLFSANHVTNSNVPNNNNNNAQMKEQEDKQLSSHSHNEPTAHLSAYDSNESELEDVMRQEGISASSEPLIFFDIPTSSNNAGNKGDSIEETQGSSINFGPKSTLLPPMPPSSQSSNDFQAKFGTITGEPSFRQEKDGDNSASSNSHKMDNLVEGLHTEANTANEAILIAAEAHEKRSLLATQILVVATLIIGIAGLILLGIGSPYAVFASYCFYGTLGATSITALISYGFKLKFDNNVLGNRIQKCWEALNSVESSFKDYVTRQIDLEENRNRNITYQTVLDLHDQYIKEEKLKDSTPPESRDFETSSGQLVDDSMKGVDNNNPSGSDKPSDASEPEPTQFSSLEDEVSPPNL